jgi:AraC family transcriptional activator of pyochelin receptor
VPLPPHSIYLFYDQKRSFNLAFVAKENTPFCIINLSIDTLHQIIAQGTDELNFSQAAIFEKEQYHHFEEASTTVRRCIYEILENQNNHLLKEAKKYAILDDYFNASRRQTAYKCPFLNQKENVTKVRDAKEYLISDLQDSPTIKALAKHVALNEHNLKTGFKEIYGKTIHAFVKDYKMSKARELILKREFQIAEIADQLGYTNVSHFIDAFKKKFGVTPKKFELSLG